jgi:crossover junction endodeoxyribonuclease RuvC
MKILGIDPGTATTGFGLIEKTGQKLKFLDAGVISTHKDLPMGERLVMLHQDLRELIAEFQPDEAAVELLFFARNVTTAMTVGQARGVIMLALAEAKIPTGEYTPMQVKQAVTNYGRADKAQIQEMVKTLLKLDVIPKPDDAADGLAIAITHATQTVG